MNVNFSKFNNSWYNPGPIWKRILWYLFNMIFFNTYIPYPYKFKVLILKLFGAKIGKKIVIKPKVNIKFPWFLSIGDNVWIGEEVWIDNLCEVLIGNNVCISQGAYIFTGNHNYKKESFDLIVKPIIIEDGVWIGAKSIICPGVRLKSHSVIYSGSVISFNTEEFKIYKTNPPIPIKDRKIEK